MFENSKNAFLSVWSNKVRSLLNVLGVVIGVASVTSLIAIGEGLKNDVGGLIQGFGTNVMFVTGGKLDTSKASQNTSNPANFITGDILTQSDVTKLEQLPDISQVTPLSLVAGSVKYNDTTAQPIIYGAPPNILDTLEILKIQSGTMFATKSDGNVIVLGPTAKQDLFGDSNAIGQFISIGEERFEVMGILDKAKSSSIFGSEFDNISIIPFDTATHLNRDQVKIMRIIVKAADTADVNIIKTSVHQTLLANHNNEEDFTVLTQDTILGLFDQFLTLATTMVSAIAAISLLVGGIGIMNIMLVTVTERTREIGLRKAVGATKSAILIQFLIEAIIVTFIGAFLGLAIAFTASAILTAKTELTPVITPTIIFIAAGISITIGIIFGLWPAIQAANKDPIEALRYE
jgi:putative ABC transport system permease protein